MTLPRATIERITVPEPEDYWDEVDARLKAEHEADREVARAMNAEARACAG